MRLRIFILFCFVLLLLPGYSNYNRYFIENHRTPSLDPMPNKVQYLQARGSGTVIIEADYADITVHMSGRAFVSEPEYVYIEHYNATRMGRWRGNEGVTYKGIRGQVSYAGQNFLLVISGDIRDLQISGSARIRFEGKGRITMQDEVVKRWNSREVVSLCM